MMNKLILLVVAVGMIALAVLRPADIQVPIAGPSSEGTQLGKTMALAVPLVAKWEGLRTTAYLDRIASPPVWTVCYGETEGVQPREVRTEAECRDGLRKGLERYRAGLHRYFTPQTRERRLTPHRDAAFTSFAWNVGIGGAGKSTATKRLNADNIKGACEALTWFNKAGGRVVLGLVNRRTDEHAYCMVGVS